MTPVQLKTAVLRKLRVISPDMPVSIEDMNVVTEKYAGFHAQLQREELSFWDVDGTIPIEAQQPLISMLAAACVSEFTIPPERAAMLTLEGGFQLPEMSLAERQLRKAVNGRYATNTLKSDYY